MFFRKVHAVRMFYWLRPLFLTALKTSVPLGFLGSIIGAQCTLFALIPYYVAYRCTAEYLLKLFDARTRTVMPFVHPVEQDEFNAQCTPQLVLWTMQSVGHRAARLGSVRRGSVQFRL
jgi:hypothetical protein